MRRSDVITALVLLGALVLGAPLPVMAETAPKPLRVVSMNLCTDQLAMLLGGEGQLVSVSYLASDPRSSAMVQQAAAYQTNHVRAEEIYLMQPDLVVAGKYSGRATVSMLKRLGIPVAQFDPAYSLNDVRARLHQMGEVLGQQDHAATLIADFDAQLAAFGEQVGARPSAALYYANGYTSGDKTLAGQILVRAGFTNIAQKVGFRTGGVIPLEVLALAEPDTVITSSPFPGASRSEEVKAHPVIRALQAKRPGASLTDHDWMCGTPFVLRAIKDMIGLRKDIQQGNAKAIP